MRPYPLWKVLAVVGLLAAGGLTALPNLFGTSPVLEISTPDGQPIRAPTVAKVRSTLGDAGIDYALLGADQGSLVVGLSTRMGQGLAAKALRESLDSHRVALGFASRTPSWLSRLGLEPLQLGLDLGGGLELLYEVETASSLNRYREEVARELLAHFERDGLAATARLVGDVVEVRVTSREASGRAKQQIESLRCTESHVAGAAPEVFAVTQAMTDAGLKYEVRLPESCVQSRRDAAVRKNIDLIRSSMPEFRVGQFSIERQGASRIRIRLANVQAPTELQRFLETRARLEFRLAETEDTAGRSLRVGELPPGFLRLEQRDGSPVLVRTEVAASGEAITEVTSGSFPRGHGVSIRLNDQGAGQMLAATETHIDKPIVTLLGEERIELVHTDGGLTPRVIHERRLVDIAIIREPVSSPVWITGLTPSEADELALQLRAGAFAAPMLKIGERVIGPGIASEQIDAGRNVVLVALSLLVVLMMARHGAFGLLAIVALVANVILTLGVLSLSRTTFTLPSAGGVLVGAMLTLSACAWIIEQIRRERSNGNTPKASISAGYKRAAGTVIAVSSMFVAGAVLLSLSNVAPLGDFAVATGIASASVAFASLAVTRLAILLIQRLWRSNAPPSGRLERS